MTLVQETHRKGCALLLMCPSQTFFWFLTVHMESQSWGPTPNGSPVLSLSVKSHETL